MTRRLTSAPNPAARERALAHGEKRKLEVGILLALEPEVLLLYSKTSIVQVPPELHRAGRTPYLQALGNVWQGSRFLGCRIGFVSEKQVLEGKLAGLKLLILPAVKYCPPEVAEADVREFLARLASVQAVLPVE